MISACPLCESGNTRLLFSENSRDFAECGRCRLLFVPRQFHLSREDERARYLLHENNPGDKGYRAFLSPLVDHLVPHLKEGARGLDYGCGPGPALSSMMAEKGFEAMNYDPFFAAHQEALIGRYDFIASSETVEHFRSPRDEFARLKDLLEPGGVMGIMTRLAPPAGELKGWWYLKDPTHISFYRRETMLWIAEKFGWKAEFPAENVVIFRESRRASTN